jgi:hypothetical protein
VRNKRTVLLFTFIITLLHHPLRYSVHGPRLLPTNFRICSKQGFHGPVHSLAKPPILWALAVKMER